MNYYVYCILDCYQRATMKFHENMNRNIAKWWERFHGINEYLTFCGIWRSVVSCPPLPS